MRTLEVGSWPVAHCSSKATWTWTGNWQRLLQGLSWSLGLAHKKCSIRWKDEGYLFCCWSKAESKISRFKYPCGQTVGWKHYVYALWPFTPATILTLGNSWEQRPCYLSVPGTLLGLDTQDELNSHCFIPMWSLKGQLFTKMATMKTMGNAEWWRGCSVYKGKCSWENWHALLRLITCLPHDLAIPFLDICPRGMSAYVHQKMCIKMLIEFFLLSFLL